MKREQAEIVFEYANRYKGKLEGALKEHLGVDTSIKFEIKDTRCGYYVTGVDTCNDVHQQMTATPLLRQLFESAFLRIQLWEGENEIVFYIVVDYKHSYMGGSNGHDLMMVGVRKSTGEVIVRK